MVSVTEATTIIQSNLWSARNEKVSLLNSLNRVLAVDVVADRDFPPYNRVTMDGIAIAFAQYEQGQRQFKIEGIQAAGADQQKLQSTQACFEVMTGAILPHGCDTVIRYEDVTIENGIATINASIQKGSSVHLQGHDAKAKSVILKKGTLISSAEIPLLASVGVSNVEVATLPKTAIVSTGNELVDVDQQPEIHQVRRSNVYAVAAGLQKYCIEPNLFHLPDDELSIQRELKNILDNHDLIILSGGVSKGKFDFIPKWLESNGIHKQFHEVKQRPGKPMWFGTGERKTVFALPGNPVSTFLCYYKYVEPWLLKSLGANYSTRQVILKNDFTFEPSLTYFLQVRLRNENGQLLTSPFPGGGSGDFVNLNDVDGFIELPPDRSVFKAGEVFPFISFR